MKTNNIITADLLINLTASSQEIGNFSAGEKRNNFFAGTNNFFPGPNNFFAGTNNFFAGTNNFFAGTNNFFAGNIYFFAGFHNISRAPPCRVK